MPRSAPPAAPSAAADRPGATGPSFTVPRPAGVTAPAGTGGAAVPAAAVPVRHCGHRR
jgi:hypothetical protein